VTHLVISAGGNDALRESGILDAAARSVGEALMKLAAVEDRFRQNYVELLQAVKTFIAANEAEDYELKEPLKPAAFL
jgi:hypothetical protein